MPGPSPSVPPALRLRLFGHFEATVHGSPLSGLHRREGARLLAFLALRAGTEVEYRTLAERFFPADARQAAYSSFHRGEYPSVRQAIFGLRQALGEEAGRLSSPAKGVVRLDLDGADVDTLAFERLAAGDAGERREALTLCRGQLLAEWTESWIDAPRARYERMRERLLAELGTEPPATSPDSPSLSDARTGDSGGALPVDSPYYVERAADAELGAALARHESVVLLKGPRQVGKTSLLARVLRSARASGNRVALTDLHMLQADDLRDPQRLALGLARMLQRQLRLSTPPEEVWNAAWGANLNLEIYLEDVALPATESPLIWVLDEVDRLFSSPYGNDLFGTFRSWHNRRALEPDGPWSRLTLVIAYATEAHLFISDLNQSPFNIGVRVALRDFTREQVARLNARLGGPLRDEEELTRFFALLGGLPYLTLRGLTAIARGDIALEEMEERADVEEGGPFGEHLRRLRVALSRDEAMREGVLAVLNGLCHSLSPDIFYRLRSGGLIAGDYPAEARSRCGLYAAYLRRVLGT